MAQSRQREPSSLTPRRNAEGEDRNTQGRRGALSCPASSFAARYQTQMVCEVSPGGLTNRRNAAETNRIIALPRVNFGADVVAEWSRIGKQSGLTTRGCTNISRKARGGKNFNLKKFSKNSFQHLLNRDLAERRICRRENQKCKKHRKQKLKSISKHLKRRQSAFSTTELFLIVSTVCRRRNAAKVICEADCDSGVQRRQSCRVNAGVRPPARSQAEQCGDLVFPRIGSVRPGWFRVRHAQAASLGVIMLCSWPWRSLAASEGILRDVSR